jgi:hypothetical protein
MSDKKPAATRLYIVLDNVDSKPVALIDATSVAQARSHFSRRAHSVKYAEQSDIMTAVKAGIEVEKAAAEPEPDAE